MTAAPFFAAACTYLLMLAAYKLARHRVFHMPAMASIIAFDLGMPVYLYTHRDWYHRLIEQQDLFSFLVWMHFGLLITLYSLEAAQIHTALKLLRGDAEARQNHRNQGKALLVVRGLVVVTGAFLA